MIFTGKDNQKTLMKSIITLLGISIMAALIMSGCDKKDAGTPAGVATTNSSMSGVDGVTGGTNSLQITNEPDMTTNRPNGSNLSGMF